MFDRGGISSREEETPFRGEKARIPSGVWESFKDLLREEALTSKGVARIMGARRGGGLGMKGAGLDFHQGT